MRRASGPDLRHVRTFILSFVLPIPGYFEKSQQHVSESAKEQCLQDVM